MQTKKQSFIESLINVTVGFLVTIISLHIIFPLLGIENHSGKNTLITIYLTILSILRNYVLRRYFNRRHYQIEK
jgi:ABC-type maltose transport system permease subunit